ncbi:MAG: hypothetical protein FWD61_12420, partial [Phycisphaerales bacterium]|nr:hypothetical protein [Phycisphaerales bacterium]
MDDQHRLLHKATPQIVVSIKIRGAHCGSQVADFHVKNKRFPSDVEFRAAAISWLDAIPATQK